MKSFLTWLLAAITCSCYAQCPNRINTNTNGIQSFVAMVEGICNVKLNADTISSLNVYYYASTDKVVTTKFELLKGKKDVGDTAINLPGKILRIEVIAPAASADKIFADMKTEVKSCTSFKVRKTYIKYAGETAELKSLADNNKSIVVY